MVHHATLRKSSLIVKNPYAYFLFYVFQTPLPPQGGDIAARPTLIIWAKAPEPLSFIFSWSPSLGGGGGGGGGGRLCGRYRRQSQKKRPPAPRLRGKRSTQPKETPNATASPRFF